MARARRKAEWERFSALMALTRNLNVDPKKTAPVPFDYFNPLVKRKVVEPITKVKPKLFIQLIAKAMGIHPDCKR